MTFVCRRIHMNIWDESLPWDTNDVPHAVAIPASRFITLSSVMRATNTCRVFRHPIGLRDEMFPPVEGPYQKH
jgi:hypothetical protein